MTSSVFPDVNVWLALNYPPHIHHDAAESWYASFRPSPVLAFCRLTQLSLFRLLSAEAVLKQDALSQRLCWEVYDEWALSGDAVFVEEPAGVETAMRARTGAESASPKIWADAYLAASAETAQLTLVTLDHALAGKVKGAVLLS
jgi:toxin-antitoxin system PIN domain toxin